MFNYDNENDNISFGWDDAVTLTNKAGLLKEGPAKFEVIKFTRGFFNGSKKMSACDQANLVVRAQDIDGVTADIKVNLPLNQKMLWKITHLFESLGLVDSSAKNVRLPWNKLVGSSGYCIVEQAAWQGNDGETHVSNQVKDFLSGAPARLAEEKFKAHPQKTSDHSMDFILDEMPSA